MKSWKFFIHHEWTLLEPWNIYEYQVIEQIWIKDFLWQSITNWARPAVCWLDSHLLAVACIVTLIDLSYVLCCDCVEGVAIKHNHIFYISLQLINKRHAQLDLTIYVFITLNIAHTVYIMTSYFLHHSTNSFKEGKIRTCRYK